MNNMTTSSISRMIAKNIILTSGESVKVTKDSVLSYLSDNMKEGDSFTLGKLGKSLSEEMGGYVVPKTLVAILSELEKSNNVEKKDNSYILLST